MGGVKRSGSFETPSPKKRLFEDSPAGSHPVRVRQIEELKKTLDKDSPAYYRLDYLWGKAGEKEAKPGLKPDTASERQQRQQAEKMQSLQDRASKAVEQLGLQPVVGVVRKRKAGRPQGSQNKVKAVPSLRKRRADVPARAKLGMIAELDRLAIEKASKRQARLQLMKQYGVSETFCYNLQRTAKRQKVSDFVSKGTTGINSARQPGSHLALVHMVRQSAGKRLPEDGKTLGRPDYLKPVWTETRAWALTEEASQHILSSGDVLADFQDRLETAIAVRQAEQTAGTLDKTGQAELKAMQQKRDSLADNSKQRDKYKVKLLAKCGLRSRSCQQTANLPPEEEKARLETAWRLWDVLLQQAASPKPDPHLPVTDVEDWARHREETAITMSDQIPAWLKPSPGKVVTSVLRLKLAREQQKLRAAARKAASTPKAKAKAKAKARQTAGARLRSATRAPGVAARWRVSFVARQAVRHYFKEDRQPLGVVMPSILVVYGKHCRLENISQKGTWVKSEKFQLGSKTVRRHKGKPVPGSLMRTWRKLRASQPELFADGSIKVWSQPAAVVDSVIYRWQLESEAEEHRQAVQLVDMFAAAWTVESMHAAALLRRAQTGIAAGCTGLTQVTDTGFGQPAKAALSRWQEELKQRMREKARQQGVHCTYRTGPSDILQAARQMHSRMVELNEKESTILRCMRQAGWFRFRPDSQGLLQDCGSQSWCQNMPEGSDKLGSEHLKDRSRWVDETGRVRPFSEEEKKAVQTGMAFETEASYLLNQEGLQTGFVLDFKPGARLLAQTEKELQSVMLQQLHPSERRRLFQKEVAATTSQLKPDRKEQKKKKLKNSKKDKARRKLLKKWRESQGSKTAQQELASVVPAVGQKSNKTASKKGKKAGDSSKPSAADKPSSRRHRAAWKQKERQQRAADRPEAFADAAVEGALLGKQARVIGDTAADCLRGQEVLCGKQTDSQVLVEWNNAQHWVLQADITLHVGDRQFPLHLDYENFPAVAAKEEAAALKDLQLYSHGDLLTDSQLQAGIREMSCRLSGGSQPDSLCLLLPAEAKLLVQQGVQALKAEAVEALQDNQKAALCLAVVQSQPPRHWSLLVLEKPRGSEAVCKVRYYDTLPGQASYKEARAVLKVLLQAASQKHQPLPAPVSELRQSDGFSCGLWVLLYVEQEWRRWLREPPQAVQTDLKARSSQLNRWLQCLLRTRQLVQLQAQQKTDSSDPAEPPPMPPPAGPPPAQTDSEKDSAQKDTTEKAEIVFGCAECGWVLAGCMRCSQYRKSASQLQTVKAKAKPKTKAKAEPKAKAAGKAKVKTGKP